MFVGGGNFKYLRGGRENIGSIHAKKEMGGKVANLQGWRDGYREKAEFRGKRAIRGGVADKSRSAPSGDAQHTQGQHVYGPKRESKKKSNKHSFRTPRPA